MTIATLDWSRLAAVESVPDGFSDSWVFRDTRMPVAPVFADIEAGLNIGEMMPPVRMTTAGVSRFARGSADRGPA